MKKKVLSKFILIISYIVIAFILTAFTYYLGQIQAKSDFIITLSIVTLTQLIMNLIYLRISKLGIFSVSGLFIVFLFLFNFGQVVLKGFVPMYEFSLFDVSEKVNINTYIISIFYCMIITFCFSIGLLITTISSFSNPGLKNHHDKYITYCKPIGLILLAISLPFLLYIDLNNLMTSISQGYLAIYNNDTPGFFKFLYNLFLPAIIFLLFAYKDKKHVIYFIIGTTLIYKLIFMFSGGRSDGVVFVIVLLFIFMKAINKFKIKQLISVSLLSFFLINIIVVIKDIRGSTNKSFDQAISSFFDSLQSNVIFTFLEEFGATLYTMSLVFNYYPKQVPFMDGAGYYLSFLTVFPNIGGILNGIISDFSWAANLSYLVPGIGGSFIAELYVNFGKASFVFAIFFGLIIGLFSESFNRALKSNNYLYVAMNSVLLSMLLLWIRNSFDFIVRSAVWTSLIILIFYFTIKTMRKERYRHVKRLD